MKKFEFLPVTLVLVLLIVPLAAQNGTVNDDEVIEVTDERPFYVIQPNDVLEIFVWKEPELSRKVLVRPDGRISVPLVQDMMAEGLTPTELRDQLETSLGEFITSPSVTVIVDAIQHYRVFVTGKVQQPGPYESTEPITVLQALTMAGGFQDYADKSEITVVRTLGREHVISKFNWGDVIKGKKSYQNIILRSGDTVVVP